MLAHSPVTRASHFFHLFPNHGKNAARYGTHDCSISSLVMVSLGHNIFSPQGTGEKLEENQRKPCNCVCAFIYSISTTRVIQ